MAIRVEKGQVSPRSPAPVRDADLSKTVGMKSDYLARPPDRVRLGHQQCELEVLRPCEAGPEKVEPVLYECACPERRRFGGDVEPKTTD